MLISEDDSPSSPGQQSNFQVPFSIAADTEHSANSEGSHETGDSGRFSHESNDELHLSSVTSATPCATSHFVSSDLGKNVMNSTISDSKESPLLFATDQPATSPLQIHSAVQN